MALSLVVISGCKKKEDAGEKATDKASAAKVTTQTPAADKAKPATPGLKEIPITTKSPEAKALFIEARTLIEFQRRAEAMPKLEEALKLDPEFAQAQLYYAVGPGTTAQEARAKVVKLAAGLPEAERLLISGSVTADLNPAAAVSDFVRLLELAPGSWRAHAAAASAYRSDNKLAKARTHFERAVELNPKNPVTYNDLAYLYVAIGELDKAVTAATKQVELSPGEANPADTKGDIELMAGDYVSAEASFRKALTLNPEFHDAKSGIAAAQIYRGKTKEGIALLSELKATPGTAIDRLRRTFDWTLALALSNKGKEALAATKSLVAPGDEVGLSGEAVAAMARARIHSHRKDFKKAASEIAKATALIEGKPTPQWQKLNVYDAAVVVAARLGDKAAANKAFKALLAVNNKRSYDIARGHLAWVEGDTDKALAEFAKVERSFQVGTALLATAELLESLKRNDEAKAVREKIRKLGRRDVDSILIHFANMESMK